MSRRLPTALSLRKTDSTFSYFYNITDIPAAFRLPGYLFFHLTFTRICGYNIMRPLFNINLKRLP